MRIFVILLTLMMTFKPVLPLVDYAVNYDYISEVLCINKDKPELQCNGKCHLKSELAKANDDSSTQDSKENAFGKRTLQVEFLENYNVNVSLRFNETFSTENNALFCLNYSFLFSNSIFHPPLV